MSKIFFALEDDSKFFRAKLPPIDSLPPLIPVPVPFVEVRFPHLGPGIHRIGAQCAVCLRVYGYKNKRRWVRLFASWWCPECVSAWFRPSERPPSFWARLRALEER